MIKIKKNVGFEGSLDDFFEHVRNLKELMPFDKPEQVIDNFNSIHERMLPYVNNLFELQPKLNLRSEERRHLEKHQLQLNTILDHLMEQDLDFLCSNTNVKKYNTYSDEDLFLHEAIPGHHYQISLQQEMNCGLHLKGFIPFLTERDGYCM